MALTREIIVANPLLAGLSTEQISALEEMSRNDENSVIGARIGELHGQYDSDILTVSGIAKNQGEKSYDYVKRVLGDFKQKAEGAAALKTTIASLEEEIKGYKKTIEEGKGSEKIAQQLKDAQQQLADARTLYDADKKAWEAKYNGLNDEYQKSLINAEFSRAMQGMKFKSIYPESVQKTLIEAAQRTVLATAKPDWIEENGAKKLVFRDEAGNIKTNKQNNLNPYTAGELLQEQLKDVLDSGRRAAGGGTTPPGGAGGGGNVLDMADIKTQVEADRMIAKYLMAQGYTRGTAEFTQKAMELREENGVDKLDVQ